MAHSLTRSLVGVLLGFACVFPLLIRRTRTPEISAESLLAQAQQQLAEAQARNRERAVQVITQKNILQAQADTTQKLIARQTERLASRELYEDAAGRRELSAQRDKTLKRLAEQQAALASAVDAAELVKETMRREERRVQQLTAEALAMKAQEKQAQIEMEIAKSRLGMTTTKAADLFAQARKKIEQAQARRNVMASLLQAAEALDEATAEADHAGNQDLYQKLTEAREALANSASKIAS